jgi:hypothetical protein
MKVIANSIFRHNGEFYRPGDKVDLPKEFATELLNKRAVKMDEDQYEKAVVKTPRKRTNRAKSAE